MQFDWIKNEKLFYLFSGLRFLRLTEALFLLDICQIHGDNFVSSFRVTIMLLFNFFSEIFGEFLASFQNWNYAKVLQENVSGKWRC